MDEEVGVITEINGMDILKTCNSFVYYDKYQEKYIGPETKYKFAEVKFVDKFKKEGVLEFYHLPSEGNFSVRYNRQVIGNAITWPDSFSEADVPLAAAKFCTEMFGYKFIVSKNLKHIGAGLGQIFVTKLDEWTDRTGNHAEYKRQTVECFKKDMTISGIADLMSGNSK